MPRPADLTSLYDNHLTGVKAVPEPGTPVLLASGGLGLLLLLC